MSMADRLVMKRPLMVGRSLSSYVSVGEVTLMGS